MQRSSSKICKKESYVLKVVWTGHCGRQMQMSLVGSGGFLSFSCFHLTFLFFRAEAALLGLQSNIRHMVVVSTDFFTISHLRVPLSYQAHQYAPIFLRSLPCLETLVSHELAKDTIISLTF